MAQFAFFDSTQPAPQRVQGWYDTDEFAYAALPSTPDLLAVTLAQWSARLANPAGWAVQNGALVPYVAPVVIPTLAQQAAAAISAGLTVALSGTLTLVATLFPTDPTTTAKIGAVVTTVVATTAFPGGASSYPMKDASGAWHTFTVAQYTKVAGAIAAYVAALDLIIDGNPLNATALPAASVALVV